MKRVVVSARRLRGNDGSPEYLAAVTPNEVEPPRLEGGSGASREVNPTDAPCNCTPIGLAEIAELTGVKRATVDTWRFRGILPPPRWNLAGGPLWTRDQIVEWSELRGRR